MNDPAGPPNPATAVPGLEPPAASTEPPAAAGSGELPPEPAVAALPATGPAVPAEPTPDEIHALELAKARRRDKGIGMGVVAVAFLIGLGISFWAKIASRPETSDPPGPPSKEGVVGYPERVDVVATLSAARALTKRSLLRGISIEGVRSNGTIDLSEGPGRARYAFQSPAGQGPQPLTEAGTSFRQPFCGRQDVNLRREGIVADADRSNVPCTSMKANDGLPDPQCTLASIWQRALARGFPSDKLARIEYFRAAAGPAWRFELPEGSHRFVLYGDCRRELKGAQAVGHVP
jgi:hypothetical protein